MNIRKAVVFPEPAFLLSAWRHVMERFYRQDGYAGSDDVPLILNADSPYAEPLTVDMVLTMGPSRVAEL